MTLHLHGETALDLSHIRLYATSDSIDGQPFERLRLELPNASQMGLPTIQVPDYLLVEGKLDALQSFGIDAHKQLLLYREADWLIVRADNLTLRLSCLGEKFSLSPNTWQYSLSRPFPLVEIIDSTPVEKALQQIVVEQYGEGKQAHYCLRLKFQESEVAISPLQLYQVMSTTGKTMTILDWNIARYKSTSYCDYALTSQNQVVRTAVWLPKIASKMQRLIYELVPKAHRNGDDNWIEHFSGIFGHVLQWLQSNAQRPADFRDLRLCPDSLLPYLGQWLGWDIYQIDNKLSRLHLQEAAKLYSEKGTRAGLLHLLQRVTGRSCHIHEYREEVFFSHSEFIEPPHLVWDVHLAKRDFINLSSLLLQLKNAPQGANVSHYFRSKMSQQMRDELDNYDSTQSPSAELQGKFIQEWNLLIDLSEVLYEEASFADIRLRPETRKLLQDPPKGKKRRYLHRLLIEDCYPRAIVRLRVHTLPDVGTFKRLWRSEWLPLWEKIEEGENAELAMLALSSLCPLYSSPQTAYYAITGEELPIATSSRHSLYEQQQYSLPNGEKLVLVTVAKDITESLVSLFFREIAGIRQQRTHLILDFSQTRYIGRSGLAQFVELIRQYRREPGRQLFPIQDIDQLNLHEGVASPQLRAFFSRQRRVLSDQARVRTGKRWLLSSSGTSYTIAKLDGDFQVYKGDNGPYLFAFQLEKPLDANSARKVFAKQGIVLAEPQVIQRPNWWWIDDDAAQYILQRDPEDSPYYAYRSSDVLLVGIAEPQHNFWGLNCLRLEIEEHDQDPRIAFYDNDTLARWIKDFLPANTWFHIKNLGDIQQSALAPPVSRILSSQVTIYQQALPPSSHHTAHYPISEPPLPNWQSAVTKVHYQLQQSTRPPSSAYPSQQILVREQGPQAKSLHRFGQHKRDNIWYILVHPGIATVYDPERAEQDPVYIVHEP